AVTVTGPWTLAADVYLARGDRVLSDAGAVREVVEALAAGVAEHVAQVRRQVPGADVVVHVDEPLLAQVGAGVLPTFSGYSRLRAVPGPDLVDGLRPVLDAARAASAASVVHLGSAWVGVAPAVLAGADAVGVTLGAWDERLWETLARASERGVGLWAALPPATVSQCAGPALGELADLVSVPWRRIGLPLPALDAVTLLGAPRPGAGTGPGRGGAGTPDEHRALLATLGRVAEAPAERAHASRRGRRPRDPADAVLPLPAHGSRCVRLSSRGGHDGDVRACRATAPPTTRTRPGADPRPPTAKDSHARPASRAVRPRRRAHADRRDPHARLGTAVRALLHRARPRPVHRRGLLRVDRRQAPVRRRRDVPRVARRRAAARRGVRRPGRGHGVRAREPQGRDRQPHVRRRGHRALPGLGPLPR